MNEKSMENYCTSPVSSNRSVRKAGMKIFRYPLGHEAGRTMTVRELREKLSEYSGDLPVFGTWEGVLGFIDPDCFVVGKANYGRLEEVCACLLIDVENY